LVFSSLRKKGGKTQHPCEEIKPKLKKGERENDNNQIDKEQNHEQKR